MCKKIGLYCFPWKLVTVSGREDKALFQKRKAAGWPDVSSQQQNDKLEFVIQKPETIVI